MVVRQFGLFMHQQLWSDQGEGPVPKTQLLFFLHDVTATKPSQSAVHHTVCPAVCPTVCPAPRSAPVAESLATKRIVKS